MSNALPVFLDPWRFSGLLRQFCGKTGLADMPRLAESLLRIEGEAKYELNFFRDNERRVRLEGTVSATAVMTCQRCLGDCEVDLYSEVSLVLVEGIDEINVLPEEVDPVILEKGRRLRSAELIEDELLLALPQIVKHPDPECSGKAVGFVSPIPEDDLSESGCGKVLHEGNPFGSLVALKRAKE